MAENVYALMNRTSFRLSMLSLSAFLVLKYLIFDSFLLWQWKSTGAKGAQMRHKDTHTRENQIHFGNDFRQLAGIQKMDGKLSYGLRGQDKWNEFT